MLSRACQIDKEISKKEGCVTDAEGLHNQLLEMCIVLAEK